MAEKENATGGQPMAGGPSELGRDAHSHFTTVNGDSISDLAGNSNGTGDDDLLIEIERLAEQSAVEPPPPSVEPRGTEMDRYLLSAGLHDEGNAQCIHRLYTGRFLFNDAYGWLAYNGKQWAIEGAEDALSRAVVDTLIRRIKAASRPEHFESSEAIRKFALPNSSRVDGAKKLYRSLVVSSPSEFDREPNLLNCSNGVVDLRSGSLIDHSPSQRFLHCVPVAYRPAADSSYWQSWLIEAVGAEMADWLQVAVGYSLTGHTSEEILFYLFGPPRAGKGIFTETLKAALGSPLAKEIDFGTFTGKRTGDSQNFDLAPLQPCRFVAASESNLYERLNEAKLKALTGGNDVYCAFKHRTHFGYRPQFKIWLSSNQPVNADPDDDAVWGRLRLVHFLHSHLGAEDKTLKSKMLSPTVLEGVLAWAVAGAMRWYRLGSQGLSEPAGGQAIKAEQRNALDTVQAWLEECCVLGSQHFTAFSELYSSYSDWASQNGVERKRQKAFAYALQHKGLRSDRGYISGKQVRGFYGLKVG